MLVLAIAAIGTIVLAHVAPFPFLLEAFAPSRSIWRMRDKAVDGRRPVVYLTYDDGPNPRATPDLLYTLGELEAHATFFLIDDHPTESTRL